MGIGAAVSSATGGNASAGAGAALAVDTNNRQLHWDGFLKEKSQCDKSPASQGCSTIEKMAGVRSQVIPESISGISDGMVIGNFDANGNVVSYTIADVNGNPRLIMQPLEIQIASLMQAYWYTPVGLTETQYQPYLITNTLIKTYPILMWPMLLRAEAWLATRKTLRDNWGGKRE